MRIPVNPLAEGPVAAPAPGVRVPRGAGGEAITEAVGNLAAVGQGLATRALDQQMQAEDEAIRSRDSTAVLQYENDALSALDETKRALADGTVKFDQADKVLKDRLKDISGKYKPQFSQRYAEAIGTKVQGLELRLGRDVAEAAEGARRRELAGNFSTTLDELQKQSVRPGADIAALNAQAENIVNTLGQQAGIPADVRARTLQNFKDAAYYNQGQQMLLTARDNPKALSALETQLTSETGYFADKLDPERRNSLLTGVLGNKARLEQQTEIAAQRAARQQEARLNRAEHAYTAFQALADKGGPLDPAYIEQVSKATADTPYADAVRQTFKLQAEVGGFAAQPIRVQDAAIDELQARINREGRNEQNDRRLAQLVKIRDQAIVDSKADPLGAVQERGLTTVTALDFSSPDAFAKSLTQRAEATAIAATYTGQPVSPLRPNEADLLKGAIERADTGTKITLLGALQARLDQPSYMAAMKQLSDKGDPQLGAIGAIANDNPQVAAAAFEGLRLLNSKTVIAPGDKKGSDALVPEFNKLIAGTGPGPFMDRQQADTAYAVAKALYVQRSHAAGDTSGALNSDRFAQALNDVTGGLVEHGGGVVIKPGNLTEDQFRLRVQAGLQTAAKSAGIPYSRLVDLPLQASPRESGVYYLTDGRDFLLDPKTGEPVRIDANKTVATDPIRGTLR